MRLERKWARVILLLWVATIVPLIGLVLLLMVQCGFWLAVLAVTLSVICAVAAVVLTARKLRCPTCGKGMAPYGWKSVERYYCPFCGKPFLFNDDPPDETETTTKEES